jgi:hypothetical protein
LDYCNQSGVETQGVRGFLLSDSMV